MTQLMKKYVAGGVLLVAVAVWMSALMGGGHKRPPLIMSETPAELSGGRGR